MYMGDWENFILFMDYINIIDIAKFGLLSSFKNLPYYI